MAILAAKLEGRAKRLRDCAVVAVPPGLDAFVAKALSRKPGDRFASAREMQQAWRGLGLPTEAPRAQLGANVPSAYPTQTALTAATHTRVGMLIPRAGLMIASVGVAVSGIAIWLALHKPRHAVEVVTEPDLVTSAAFATQEAPTPTTSLPTIELVDNVTTDAGRPRARWRGPQNKGQTKGATQTGSHFTTEPRY
jgi:hypothetical protein